MDQKLQGLHKRKIHKESRESHQRREARGVDCVILNWREITTRYKKHYVKFI